MYKSLPAAVFLLFLAVPLHSQERPLATDAAELLPVGRIRLQMGVEFFQNQRYSLSGLEGDLTRLGVGGIHIGVGEYAEFQISGTVRDFLSVTRRTIPVIKPDFDGNATSDFGDLLLAAKLRLARETGRKPALAFKFAVQLPNAGNESGLGTDEMAFYGSILASKHLGPAQLLGNVGIAILGSPVQANTQADLLTYGFGLAVPLHSRVDLVGEINGRQGAERVGNENQSRIRLGVRIRSGGLRWDLAGIAGLKRYDPDTGLAMGITYEFQGFRRDRQPKTIR